MINLMLALNLTFFNRKKTPINVLNKLAVVSVYIFHVIFLILLSV
jgi:hypothetical protein